MFFEQIYTVDTRDVDPFGHCRPSAVLGILQEAATYAAQQLGCTREETLERYNCFWMLARIWYRLERPLRWDEPLTVRTWHRAAKGASIYRDFDLYVGDEYVGEAVSTWVLADYDTHRLLRMSKVVEFQSRDGGELCKERTLSRIAMPEPMEPAGTRRMHYSDADVNGHVNNNRYADFICDAVELERRGEGKFVSELQVGFLAECRPGETIGLSVGRDGESWFVHGGDAGGKSRFDGMMTLADLP